VTHEWGTMADDGTVNIWRSEENARSQFEFYRDCHFSRTLVRREVGPWLPVVSEAAKTAEYGRIITERLAEATEGES
jgi:hypothetical protein